MTGQRVVRFLKVSFTQEFCNQTWDSSLNHAERLPIPTSALTTGARSRLCRLSGTPHVDRSNQLSICIEYQLVGRLPSVSAWTGSSLKGTMDSVINPSTVAATPDKAVSYTRRSLEFFWWQINSVEALLAAQERAWGSFSSYQRILSTWIRLVFRLLASYFLWECWGREIIIKMGASLERKTHPHFHLPNKTAVHSTHNASRKGGTHHVT